MLALMIRDGTFLMSIIVSIIHHVICLNVNTCAFCVRVCVCACVRACVCVTISFMSIMTLIIL